jgi:hypothetical protein
MSAFNKFRVMFDQFSVENKNIRIGASILGPLQP